MRIACAQLQTRGTQEWEKTLEEALNQVDRAAQGGAELVLLPEAVFPGYVLGPWLENRTTEDVASQSRKVLETFARKAWSCGIGILVGLVTVQKGRYYNSVVLLGPRGEELGRRDKGFLWHFDRVWFAPGEKVETFETPWGRVGLLVCADARIPEIARAMARQGAWLLLDGANLTSTSATLEEATNQQVAFMLSSRARENGVYLAMANKCGLERNAVLYCGKSTVWDPQGEILAQSGATGEDLIFADLDREKALKTKEQRTFPAEAWKNLCRSWESPSSPRGTSQKLSSLLVGTVQCQGDFSHTFDWFRHILWDMHIQGASLVLLPLLENFLGEKAFQFLEDLSRAYPHLTLVSSGMEGKAAEGWVFKKGSPLTPVRGRAGEVPVYEEPWGCFGLLRAGQGGEPEFAREAALAGVPLLLWSGGEEPRKSAFVYGRTRAAENRLFVALAGASCGAGIFGPGGEILAQGLRGTSQAVLGKLFLSLAQEKELVPGTNVITGRTPGQYGVSLSSLRKPCEEV